MMALSSLSRALHLQIALAQELGEMRSSSIWGFTTYVEGWVSTRIARA